MKNQQNYIVLARKYRPKVLKDLVGQDVLQTTLKEMIRQQKLPPAILLYGTRGVGKTTTARIIARSVNCVGVDGKGMMSADPCGQCNSCLSLDKDKSLDVVEFDAASRTGVDDIREIIESTQYKAVGGRFKVFIIDEVHMLSKSAFNALLKVLEEPPAHVIFIFATTELHKVPDTILSRCAKFDLGHIKTSVINDHLKEICKHEDVKADDDALVMLARSARGSMRDGLSLLDQSIALSRSQNMEQISVQTVESMMGIIHTEVALDVIEKAFEGDSAFIIQNLQTYFQKGVKPLLFMQNILELTYHLLCYKQAPSLVKEMNLTENELSKIKHLSSLDLSTIMRLWQVLSSGFEEIQKSPLPKETAIILFLKFCHLIEMFGKSIVENPQKDQSSKITTTTDSRMMGQTSFQQTDSIDSKSTALVHDFEPYIVSSVPMPETFEDLLVFLKNKKEELLVYEVTENMYVVSYHPPTIVLDSRTPKDLIAKFRKKLLELYEKPWNINSVSDTLGFSIREKNEKRSLELLAKAQQHPAIQHFQNIFPEIITTVEDDTL
ncbi:MAG: DNA polymerase III, subunit gamma and tau [Candidatus Puniceispirillum sp.]|nr:DNA polymerase III, subunit gamma and tau [Candidatus Pelagibacter sp.]MBA4282946.1 DNA polymerase III, subunit gamma and tau [Candidatus Puniceispirillum sp.]